MRFVFILGSTILLFPTSSTAVPVTWSFTGTVRTFEFLSGARSLVAPPALAAVGVDHGAPISGTFTFESETADSNTSPTYGSYGNVVTAASMSVGSLDTVLAAVGTNDISINLELFLVDHIWDGLFEIVDDEGLDLCCGGIELLDSTGSVFSSDALFLGPPDLADLDRFDLTGFPPFNTSIFFGVLNLNSDAVLVRAELTSLVVVPEPSTFWLAAVGLLYLTMRSRGHNR